MSDQLEGSSGTLSEQVLKIIILTEQRLLLAQLLRTCPWDYFFLVLAVLAVMRAGFSQLWRLSTRTCITSLCNRIT